MSLIVCGHCGCHVHNTEIDCPHCGGALYQRDGSRLLTVAALAAGLTLAGAVVSCDAGEPIAAAYGVASSSSATSSGGGSDGGNGGAGGDDAGNGGAGGSSDGGAGGSSDGGSSAGGNDGGAGGM